MGIGRGRMGLESGEEGSYKDREEVRRVVYKGEKEDRKRIKRKKEELKEW